MAFIWSDYLGLARDLARRTDEAALRSAVSRSYYAAYCTAVQTLKAKNVKVKRRRVRKRLNSHEAIWYTFRSDSRADWQKVGLEGDRLKRERVNADYRAHLQRPRSAARNAVTRSDSILQLLAKL